MTETQNDSLGTIHSSKEGQKHLSYYETMSREMSERFAYHETQKISTDNPQYSKDQISAAIVGMLPEIVRMGEISRDEAEKLIEQYNNLSGEHVSYEEFEQKIRNGK